MDEGVEDGGWRMEDGGWRMEDGGVKPFKISKGDEFFRTYPIKVHDFKK
jgi:hypothetical protein